MTEIYIVTYLSGDEHSYKEIKNSYKEIKKEGPFTLTSALHRLIQMRGIGWVEENMVNLISGIDDGTIAWWGDKLGYSLTRSDEEVDPTPFHVNRDEPRTSVIDIRTEALARAIQALPRPAAFSHDAHAKYIVSAAQRFENYLRTGGEVKQPDLEKPMAPAGPPFLYEPGGDGDPTPEES